MKVKIVAFETGQRCQPLPLERPRLLTLRGRAPGDNDPTTADPVRACWPVTQERLRAERRVLDVLPAYEDELHRRLRRLDALVWAVGLLLLAVAAAATYVGWEYARPFVTTDDPFLPARHSLIVVRAIVPNPAWQRAAGSFNPRCRETAQALRSRGGQGAASREAPEPRPTALTLRG